MGSDEDIVERGEIEDGVYERIRRVFGVLGFSETEMETRIMKKKRSEGFYMEIGISVNIHPTAVEFPILIQC